MKKFISALVNIFFHRCISLNAASLIDEFTPRGTNFFIEISKRDELNLAVIREILSCKT